MGGACSQLGDEPSMTWSFTIGEVDPSNGRNSRPAHVFFRHHSRRRRTMLGKADATPMIAVKDLDRARKFYEDTLGLKTKER